MNVIVRLTRAACAAALFTAVPGAGAAWAQDSGRLTIVVDDSSGARVSGAVVTVSRGNDQKKGDTDQRGIVELSELATGEWRLMVDSPGFATREQFVVVQSSPATVTVRLQLAGLEQSVEVSGVRGSSDSLQLDRAASGGSYLDIPIRDLPATLTVVTQEMMQERGAYSNVDAILLAGGTEATRGSSSVGYRSRGFSGNSVSVMRDGIRQNTISQSSRPIDTFVLDRVEVLKGPASLLYGEGALGAAVNYVSKQPGGPLDLDATLSYGSFGTSRVGIGANLPLHPTLSARIDASQSDTDGYVADSGERLRGMTASLLWTPHRRVSIKPSFTFTDDSVQSYYSTPLVNGEVDPRMRFLNYNIEDNISQGINKFTRVDTDIELPGGWRLRNGFFMATQVLDWRNMEGYSYNATTRRVQVSSYFLIRRDDLLFGDQVEVRKRFGQRVNFIAGYNANRNYMDRGVTPTPPGTAGVTFSVDPYDPEPIFDPGLPWFRQREITVLTNTLFAEAQTRVTGRLNLVTGLRWEDIRVDYLNTGTTGVLDTTSFQPFTGRVGAVYTVFPDVNAYVSYSRATEPFTQFANLDASQHRYELTPGQQIETGAKATAFNGRLDGTFAYYYIVKENIPTRTEIDGQIIEQQIGKQRSQGVETNVALRAGAGFTMHLDVALTLAKYLEFNENQGTGFISRTGNTPSGVPVLIWSLTPSQRLGPVTVAASARRIGERWADNANTAKRPQYTTLDAWASLRVPFARQALVTVRGRNLTDKLYTPGGGSNTSARLAAPRSYEVSLTVGLR